MDDLLNVAQQLENMNPSTPGGARQSSGRPRQGPPPPQVGTQGETRPRGVSSIRIEALLSKTLSKLDTHIVSVLTRPISKGAEEKLELDLLDHLRRSLQRHSGEVPKDVSVCESLHDVITQAEQAFDALASADAERLLTFTSFLRGRYSLARALGVASPDWLTQLKQVKEKLKALTDAETPPTSILDTLSMVHLKLNQALQTKEGPKTLLESILRT